MRKCMHLRHAKADDASAISELVQAGFIAHIAPDWEPSAQRSFLEDTQADKLAPKVSQAAVCLVCEQGDQVLGVIFLPRPTLVQLLFVAPGHLRKGIARALWQAVRDHLQEKHPEVTTVELNSSPYAVAAYQALGFFPISQPFRRKGAIATRMACWLPGKALEQSQHEA
jgi:GNAT superfamily N-acetyltransferase